MPAAVAAPTDAPLVYRLDPADRLVSVAGGWDGFALANGAPGLVAARVLGRSIWEFVAGAETVSVYEALFAAARAGHEVRFELRCDAPHLVRRLELSIAPLPRGGLELRSRTRSVVARDPVALLDPRVPRSEDVLTSCGWCRRMVLPGGAWVDAAEAVRRLDLFAEPSLPRLSHGICPGCAAHMRQALAGLGGPGPGEPAPDGEPGGPRMAVSGARALP